MTEIYRNSESCGATRRQFLQSMAAAGASTLMLPEPRLLSADEVSGTGRPPEATADSCILLWMAGGMAATETFDPKRYSPFKVGTPVEKVISTFPTIDTAVDNIKICEGLERIAAVMDRATLIRSHYLANLGPILHSRHQSHWHTGYIPPQSVAAPHIGAWMARILGPNNPAIPPFINIGQHLDGNGEADELKAFTTAGFLGREYGPLNLPCPDKAARAVCPRDEMTRDRFQSRHRALKKRAEQSPPTEYLSGYHQQSMLRSIDRVHRLLSSKDRRCFDLTLEPKESFEKYDTGRFGRGCLLAHRLVELGAQFVEVTTEYISFVHWDTHEKGHRTVDRLHNEIDRLHNEIDRLHNEIDRLHNEIDRPIAQLVLDLEERGLLNRTLVIVASEFSRDMIAGGILGSDARDPSRACTDVLKSTNHYRLHHHFTGSSSVLMFGGGVKRSLLYGESGLEKPCVAIKDPVSITDLHATIFRAMGTSPQTAFEVERRPFYVTQDGTGKPDNELFTSS